MKNGRWNKSLMPLMTARIAVVTGANSGLGFETSLALVERGCEVVMACRNVEKGHIARDMILKRVLGARVEVLYLDLSDLASVEQFAVTFRKKYRKLDLLINNAGAMALPYSKTKEGFELQFGVNYLGHFVLSSYLMDPMKRAYDARIVNVTSLASKWGRIRYEDIHWEKKYFKMRAYAMSKLAILLFSKELADRFADSGVGIKVVAAHPGYSNSSLFEKAAMPRGAVFFRAILRFANNAVAMETSKGALSILYAATDRSVESGDYYGPNGLFGLKGYPKMVKGGHRKINKPEQERLWCLSEKLSGENFHL